MTPSIHELHPFRKSFRHHWFQIQFLITQTNSFWTMLLQFGSTKKKHYCHHPGDIGTLLSFCSKQTTPLHHHLHPLLLLVDLGILFDHLDQSLLMDPRILIHHLQQLLLTDPGILIHHLQQLLLTAPGILSPSSTTSSYRSWNLFHHLHQTCFFQVLEVSLSIIYNSTFFFFQIQEFSLFIIYTNFFLWILEFSLLSSTTLTSSSSSSRFWSFLLRQRS